MTRLGRDHRLDTRGDYLAKPDLVAPGHGVLSLSSPGSSLYVNHPELLVDGKARLAHLKRLDVHVTGKAVERVKSAESIDELESARADGVDIVGQVAGRSIGVLECLHTRGCPLCCVPQCGGFGFEGVQPILKTALVDFEGLDDRESLDECGLELATLAGLLPAWRAAKLNPSEALRHE